MELACKFSVGTDVYKGEFVESGDGGLRSLRHEIFSETQE
jgi:hypothetical protein